MHISVPDCYHDNNKAKVRTMHDKLMSIISSLGWECKALSTLQLLLKPSLLFRALDGGATTENHWQWILCERSVKDSALCACGVLIRSRDWMGNVRWIPTVRWDLWPRSGGCWLVTSAKSPNIIFPMHYFPEVLKSVNRFVACNRQIRSHLRTPNTPGSLGLFV